MKRRLLVGIGLALFVLAAVVLVRTLRLPAPPGMRAAPAAQPDPPLDAAAQRLAAALRIPTVSHDAGGAPAGPALAALREHLATSFPRTHQALARELVGGDSLLYTWRGARPELPPVLLMAHLDVVPVEDVSAWTHPPFAGVIEGGFVWGRGAIDDKQGVLGILEACELLLAEGFTPARTVHLAFGHDEEASGRLGAARIAALLRQRGVRLAMVLDEGGFYTTGLMPGVEAPVAMVGVAEKGYLSLALEAEGEGGHSSRPAMPMAIATLARALDRLASEPFPARLDGATRSMLETLAPRMAFGRRLAIANLWLFEPLVVRGLTADPSSAALVRTTTALTMVQGGQKENVLPRRARAVVNFRILPGETVAATIAHARAVIDDPRVAVRPITGPELAGEPPPLPGVEPSTVSPVGSPAWQLIAEAAQGAWDGDLAVAPYLLTGATDARHFAELTGDIYRFSGYTVTARDVTRFHGVDERIAVEDYGRVIEVYYRVLRGLDRL
jgi:carboxypeptidase PM20D1